MIGPRKGRQFQTIHPLSRIHCHLLYLTVRFLLDLNLRDQIHPLLLLNWTNLDYAILCFATYFGARR